MNRIIELSELNKLEKDMPTLLYNLNKKKLYTNINDLSINYIQHDDIIKSLRMDPGDRYGK